MESWPWGLLVCYTLAARCIPVCAGQCGCPRLTDGAKLSAHLCVLLCVFGPRVTTWCEPTDPSARLWGYSPLSIGPDLACSHFCSLLLCVCPLVRPQRWSVCLSVTGRACALALPGCESRCVRSQAGSCLCQSSGDTYDGGRVCVGG